MTLAWAGRSGGPPAAALGAVRDALRASAADGEVAVPRGGGTKDALSAAASGAGERPLDVAPLDGIVEYAPSEFTVTALAGTPVATVRAALAEHGQSLPFDPILVDAGATLGGTIAAGVSGSGRVRYGGIRDFVLGVRFLDGDGTLVRGGGKVVKNAAGFDLPKLMVGSLGSLGVLVEVTLKVFPVPEAAATGRVDFATLDGAVDAMRRVLAGPCEVDALDLEPPGRLWLRVAGRQSALESRLERALAIASGTAAAPPGEPTRRSDPSWSGGASGASAATGRNDLGSPPAAGFPLSARLAQPAHAAAAQPAAAPDVGAAQRVDDSPADAHWRDARELAWAPSDAVVVKVPLQPGRIGALEQALAGALAGRAAATRYTGAGQQALVAWPAAVAIDALDRALDEQGFSGLAFRGPAARRRLGRRPGEEALERVRQALDPRRRFRAP